MKAIYRILDDLENRSFGFGLFIVTFLSIVIIRSFLENFAVLSIGDYNFFFQWTAGLVHFPLWFANVFVWTAVIAHLFTKENIIKITKLMIFSFPIILLPVIADLLLTGGEGRELSYFFPKDLKELFSQTLFFFFNKNISAGLRMEIFISSLAVIFYSYRKTTNILKTIGAALTFYITLIAIHGSLPGLIFIFEKSIGNLHSAFTIQDFYQNILLSSQNIAVGRGYFLINQMPWEIIYGLFNLTTALFIFPALIIGLLMFFYFWNKDKLITFLKNLRPNRLAHYWLMAVFGIGISYLAFQQMPAYSTFNIMSLIVLLLTIAAFRLFAIGINDINDIECDRVSNTHRPLITGALTVDDIKNTNIVLFLISIWGASILGYRILLFILCAHAISFIYSSPPLRLKNFPIINSFLISSASLLFAMSGFFMFSPSLEFVDFPKKFLLLIIICGTLAANLKDIKDISGDKLVGTKTILVIFGEKTGKRIVGTLMLGAMALAPVILGVYQFVPFGLILGILAIFAINQKEYKEKVVIGIYFIYIIFLSVSYILNFQ